MFPPEWWHWIVLGLALTMAEMAIPAFFIVWFGRTTGQAGLKSRATVAETKG